MKSGSCKNEKSRNQTVVHCMKGDTLDRGEAVG